MEGNLATVVDEAIERRIAADPRIVVLNYVTVNTVLVEDWNVPAKGRRSIRQRVHNRLQAHFLEKGLKAERAAGSRTWVYPSHEAREFIRNNCAEMIRAHIDRVVGQERFSFKVVKLDEAREKRKTADAETAPTA